MKPRGRGRPDLWWGALALAAVLAVSCEGEVPACEGDADCPAGSSCQHGACRATDPCAGVSCATGELCAAGLCVPEDCATRTCAAGQGCFDGVCADRSCAGVACAAGEACAAGRCLSSSCAGIPCGTDVCVDGACEERSCVGVACPDGEACAGGACHPVACDVPCGPAEVCAGGGCVERHCAGVRCAAGEICARGACFPQACGGVTCGTGQACVGGACEGAACLGVACADGERCSRGACWGESCGSQACGEGRLCDGGRCVEEACAGLRCPERSSCVAGACVECGPEICGDGLDQDCDGSDLPEDADADGQVDVACGGADCDDHDPLVNARALEICDGIDDDCDGEVDEPSPSCGPVGPAYPRLGLRHALILGPVPLGAGGTCAEPGVSLPGGEAAADPQPGERALGLAWRVRHVRTENDIDLARLAGADGGAQVAWVFQRLVLEVARDVVFTITTRDAALLWVDGAQTPLRGGEMGACDRAGVATLLSPTIHLEPGVHRLLLRSVNGSSSWTLGCTSYYAQPGDLAGVTGSGLTVDVGDGNPNQPCRPGTRTCNGAGPGVCASDAIAPTGSESCATTFDDDCDGSGSDYDEDRDGIDRLGCGAGPDCDDRDPHVGPGNPERCDVGGRDEDCDPGTPQSALASPCGAGPELPLGPAGEVPGFLLLGPFDSPGVEPRFALDDRDVLASWGAGSEADASPLPGDVAGPFAWEPWVPAPSADGSLDLGARFAGDDVDRVTAYAFAVLHAERPGTVTLTVGATAGVVALWNGVPVARIEEERVYSPGDFTAADLPLLAGENRLLVRASSIAGPWWFTARVTDGQGAPPAGVTVSLHRGSSTGACRPGSRTCSDAGWGSCQGAVGPAPEACNGADDDCDGLVDDDCT